MRFLPILPSQYHELAHRRGFLWLGPEVPRVTCKTSWRCPHGHSWAATYHKIHAGRGCPRCAHASRRDKQRHPAAAYRKLAEARGFGWLGPEVLRVAEKTEWQCPKGHRWWSTYNCVQQGAGCHVCAGNRPLRAQDFHVLAQGAGLIWLGTEPVGSGRKTCWECAAGHQWEAPYSTIRAGHRCPACAGRLPVTPQRYRALAREHSLEWLGPIVRRLALPTRWRCVQGHDFAAPFSSIWRGRSCPRCALQRRSDGARFTEAEYRHLAAQRDFEWLGPLPPTVRTRTGWRCTRGHAWRARYDHIRRGHGCPKCAGVTRKGPPDYHSLAASRGFRWLGRRAPSVLRKTSWECATGHRWRACYSKLQQGSGCPLCADMVGGKRVSRPQRKLARMLGGELNVRVGNYFVDVALELPDGTRVAAEYDSWWFHAERQEQDELRAQALVRAGWSLLRVRSNSRVPTAEQIRRALARLGNGERVVIITLDDWGRGMHHKSLSEQTRDRRV